MDGKSRRKIIQGIRTLSKHAIPMGSVFTLDRSLDTSTGSVLGEGPCECLISDAAYPDFIAIVLETMREKPELQEKFTADQVASAVGNIVGCLARDANANAEQLLIDLYNRADAYSTEQVVYVPLGGIQLRVSPLTIGPVTLVKLTGDRYRELHERISQSLGTRPSVIDGVHEDEGVLLGYALPPLQNSVCAEFQATATPERAREVAMELVGEVIDLLRFAIATHFPRVMRVHVGFQWEVHAQWHMVPVLAKNLSEFNLQSRLMGYGYPLVVDDALIDRLRQFNVFDMADLLTLPDPMITPFERTLLHSIHWFANAHTQRSTDDAVLSLFVCLETLFTPGDQTLPVTNAVAEGAAFLLGKDSVERRAIKEQVKHWYGVRSDITHGRHSRGSDSAALELSQVASRCLSTLIERRSEFPEKKSLLDWLEERRLS